VLVYRWHLSDVLHILLTSHFWRWWVKKYGKRVETRNGGCHMNTTYENLYSDGYACIAPRARAANRSRILRYAARSAYSNLPSANRALRCGSTFPCWSSRSSPVSTLRCFVRCCGHIVPIRRDPMMWYEVLLYEQELCTSLYRRVSVPTLIRQARYQPP
jgi:hypothetical protein